MMLQQDEPDDYVIATGESRSVKEFVHTAFALVGLDPDRYIEIDAAYLRPADVPELRGDATKANTELGWTPMTSFETLVHEMLESDLTAEGVDASKHLRKPPATAPIP